MKGLRLEKLLKLKILNELREIYYRNTGMTISFHYPGKGDRFDFYPENQRSEYCRLVQATGKASVFGSLVGILAMYLLLNGFNLLGLNPFWEVIILGIILNYVIRQGGITRSFRAFFARGKA